MIEIPGPDGPKKADELAARLREVLGNDAMVSRPVIKGEVRLVGLDDSVSIAEVRAVIAKEGDCVEEDVKPGPIRQMYNGLGSVWLQCPLSAAIKVSEKEKIKIGWTVARAELLKARPVQCFRCWKFGHVRFACRESVDRTGRCFRCGETGHKANECVALPRCVICAESNHPSDHRLGSMQCSANPNRPGAGAPVPSTLIRTREQGVMDYSDRRTENMDIVDDQDRGPAN